jgi:hypothetical protein
VVVVAFLRGYGRLEKKGSLSFVGRGGSGKALVNIGRYAAIASDPGAALLDEFTRDGRCQDLAHLLVEMVQRRSHSRLRLASFPEAVVRDVNDPALLVERRQRKGEGSES